MKYGLHGQEKDGESAFEDIIDMVIDFFSVNKIDNREKFQEIVESQDNHILSDYWRVYRKTEMKLAVEKRDLGSGMEESLLNNIQNQLLFLLLQENPEVDEGNKELK